MEDPGCTLFQPSEVFNMNAITEDDDDEAQQEKQERDAKLDKALEGAFDDLHVEDNNESFASSDHHLENGVHMNGDAHLGEVDDKNDHQHLPHKGHQSNGHSSAMTNVQSLHYQHCFQNLAFNVTQESPNKLSGQGDSLVTPKPFVGMMGNNEVAHLANLYSVRNREIARLQQQATQRESEWTEKQRQLEKKVVRLEAEKAAAHTTNVQTQALLVSSKEQIADLLKELEAFKKKHKDQQSEKGDMEQELLVCHTTIDSLQGKIEMMERSGTHRVNADLRADTLLRSVQEQHRKEVTSLHQQIDTQTAKIEAMDAALRESDRRLRELNRTQEVAMLDRTETVNRLMQRLDESQRHCQALMAEKSDLPNMANMMQEKERLEKELQLVKRELAQKALDVDQLETQIGLNILIGGDSELPGINSERLSTKVKNLGQLRGVQEELARALRAQEVRRTEVKKMTEELREAEEELADFRKKEDAFKEALTKIQKEYKQLVESQSRQNSIFSQLSGEQIMHIKQENERVKKENHELMNKIERLQQDNCCLAEKTVEIERACEEDKIRKVAAQMETHAKEFLAYNQRAVGNARQEEREKAEMIISNLRKELELEKRSSDEVKAAYVTITQGKAALLAEIESLRLELARLRGNQNAEQPTHDNEAQTSLCESSQYEQRVIAEVSKAREALLKDVAAAKEQEEKQFEARLAAAKSEWQAQNASASARQAFLGQANLQEEVERLTKELHEQSERLTRERREAEKEAWNFFQNELHRLTEHYKTLTLETPKPASRDQAISTDPQSLPSSENAEMTSKLQTEVEFLKNERQREKSYYEHRLAEVQVHLNEKTHELEDFKRRTIEFTNKQTEILEKENTRFINILKSEIASLNTQLEDQRKKSDNERLKFGQLMDKWSAEVHNLRAEKQKTGHPKVEKLVKQLEQMKDYAVQLKEFYERREQFLSREFRKREDKLYEMFLKLKTEVNALVDLQFPKLPYPLDLPTHDC